MWIEFEAENARRKATYERDTVLAYQAVRIWVKTMNDGKMPPLRSLLEPNRRQTPAEQRAAVTVIAGQFGLPMRARKKVKRA